MRGISKLTTAALSVVMVVAAHAEDVEKQEWHFSPYFWLPSMDVTSKIPGLPPADLDLGFDEIWENFDVFAISARGEYWWGQFGFVVDGLWMDMKADGLGPMQNADIQISDGIVDTLAAYRFNLKGGGPDVASMRLMAGALPLPKAGGWRAYFRWRKQRLGRAGIGCPAVGAFLRKVAGHCSRRCRWFRRFERF